MNKKTNFFHPYSVSHSIKAGIIFLLLSTLLAGCIPQHVDPMTLGMSERDKQEAPYPPMAEELSTSPKLMLPLVVYKEGTVTDERAAAIMKFVEETFEHYANFSVVSMNKVNELLASEENRRFQASNVADAIQLGKSLNASFVAQLQLLITESKIVKNVDQYTANINLTIFTTGSGQVVFKKDVTYNSQEQETSVKDFKWLVQESFPLRGFIIETRGDRQYGKISLGRSLGIKIGRTFLVRQREVKNEIVMGLSRRTVSFSPLAVSTVEVIQVMEDESWVSIPKGDRDKVQTGMVVFSKPEKSNIYF